MIHTWESPDALAAYRLEMSPRHEVELAALGATVERYVGAMTAEPPSLA